MRDTERAMLLMTSGRWVRRGSTIVIELPEASLPERLSFELETSQPTLRRGSRGSGVTALQTRLGSLGFNSGPTDGIFGFRTDSAVRAFQGAQGIHVDGIVGPQTWMALNASPAPAPSNLRAPPPSNPWAPGLVSGVPVAPLFVWAHLKVEHDPCQTIRGPCSPAGMKQASPPGRSVSDGERSPLRTRDTEAMAILRDGTAGHSVPPSGQLRCQLTIATDAATVIQ